MRAGLAVVAVAVLAWLGAMERSTRLQAEGSQAAEARDAAAAESAFRAARLLNPDTLPDVRRAIVRQGSGEPAAAAALLADVVRREPDNLDAWGLLYAFTRDRDPALARRALEQRARLDPLGAARSPR